MRRFYFFFSIIAVALVSSFLFWFYAIQRYDYHVDEFYSYGHSNNMGMAYLDKKMFDNNWHFPEEFHRYVTVQEGERFSYSHIFTNLKSSVHPPLFYILLHTAASFFPDVFSKWIGISLNYGIFILLHIAFYFLMRRVTGDKKIAVLACLALGLSSPVLDTALFIRSYLLMMLWSILFVYHSLEIGRENKTSGWGRIYLIALAGFLTHYYFLIFAFFVTMFFAVPMLFRKAYRKMLCYMSSVLAAVFTLFAVFPTAYSHLLKSERGVEAGVNFHSNAHGSFLSFLSEFYTYMLTRFFDARSLYWVKALLLFLLLVLIANAGLYLFKNRAYLKNPLHYFAAVSSPIKIAALFLFISFCYFVGISIVAPFRWLRYYTPILPLLLASLFLVMQHVSCRLHLKGLLFYILIAFLLSGVIFKRNVYVGSFSPQKAYLMSQVKDKPVLSVLRGAWEINNLADILMTSDKSYAIHKPDQINTSLIPALNQLAEPHAILILEEKTTQEIVARHSAGNKTTAHLSIIDVIRSDKDIRYLFETDWGVLHLYIYQITPRKESP